MSTTRSLERTNEVGLRKILGADRFQLFKQFLLESFLINVLAIGLALVFWWLSQSLFEELDAHNVITSNLWSTAFFWLMLLALLALGTIFSGVYPALVISGFKPISIIGLSKGKSQGGLMRKYLVVFQFTTSIILIVATVVIYNQIQFMRNAEIGIDLNNTIAIRAPLIADSTYQSGLKFFKSEVEQSGLVQKVVATFDVPGKEYTTANWFRGVNQTTQDGRFLNRSYADEDFIPTMGIKLIAGRNFVATDNHYTSIINRSAMELLGFDGMQDALGGELTRTGNNSSVRWRIVGVIEDYHQLSLKQAHSPLMIAYVPNIRNYYIVKFNDIARPQAISEIIDLTERVYKRTFPDNPFNFFFPKTQFENQYLADKRFGSLIGLFTVVAIVIGCLGLFGLSSYIALLRTKEIGIRKVLGSSVPGILSLLTKDYLKLILVSSLIAWPLAYYVTGRWLEGFAEHTQVQIWIFPIATLVVATITIVTTCFNSVKSATTNPINSLKNE